MRSTRKFVAVTARGRRFIAFGSLLGVVGCANVLGIEDTEVVPSCQPGDFAYDGGNGPGEGSRNGGTNQNFSCVGNLPVGQIAETATVNITLVIVNLVNPAETISGMKVRACASRADVKCTTNPVEAVSDENGFATLQVATLDGRTRTGYTGYFEITGPDSQGRAFIPYLQYFSRPIITDRVYPVAVVRPEDFANQFPEDTEVASDPNYGVLAFEAVDCENAKLDGAAQGAPNVRFSVSNSCEQLSAASREFYFDGSTPSTSASKTQAAGLAIGGFIGVTPGSSVVVQGYWNTGAQNLKVVEERIAVRAGWLTTMRFEPNQ